MAMAISRPWTWSVERGAHAIAMSSSFKRRGREKSAVRTAADPDRHSSASSTTATAPTSSSSSSPLSASLDPPRARDGNPARAPSRPEPPTQRCGPTPPPLRNAPLPGTRPWTSNLTVTSFGLREMDALLFSAGGSGRDGGGAGGGQPLGTLTVLEEDRLSDDLCRALCRCWCAEGVAQRQRVVLAGTAPSLGEWGTLDDEDVGDHGGASPEELWDFLRSLPLDLHLQKSRERAAKGRRRDVDGDHEGGGREDQHGGSGSRQREAISAIVEEGEDEEEGEEDDTATTNPQRASASQEDGLVNAWQYRTSIQDHRRGISGGATAAAMGGNDNVYCHSYDLSRRMWDQFEGCDGAGERGAAENPLRTHTRVVDCSVALSSRVGPLEQGMALFARLWECLREARAAPPSDGVVVRLFVPRLPIGPGAAALPLLLARLRREGIPAAVLVTVRPWRCLSSPLGADPTPDALAALRSAADVVLALDAFSSFRAPPPPEFALLHGILTVRKCAAFHAGHYTDSVVRRRPLAERFGVKRDARKVTAQLLHLPPEEYSRGGSSTEGVRSGGGRDNGGRGGGCASVGGGVSLDF